MDTLKPRTITPTNARLIATKETSEKMEKAERKRVLRVKNEIARSRRVVEKYENKISGLVSVVRVGVKKLLEAERMRDEAQKAVREWEAKL